MADSRWGALDEVLVLQLFLLGGAFTLASLIIFFLGIFVGKGIEERKIVKKEEPLVRIPVKPQSLFPIYQSLTHNQDPRF